MLQNPKYFIYFCTMKRLFFIISLLLCLPLAAQQTYHARVVDAETGEALPLVQIYSSSKHGAQTNYEGVFSIQAEEYDVLQVSFIGYEQVKVSISSLPSVIKLRPLSQMMHEVEVWGTMGNDKMLEKAWKKLCREYAKNLHLSRSYFFRFSLSEEENVELVEGLFRAQSAANLRNIVLHSLRHYTTEKQSNDNVKTHFTTSNLMHLILLGPMVQGDSFWNDLRTPFIYVPPKETSSRIVRFGDGATLREEVLHGNEDEFVPTRFYAVKRTTLKSSKGKRIYKIHMTASPYDNLQDSSARVLEGDVYLDRHCRLLAFDGELSNYSLRWTENRDTTYHPTRCHLHVDYCHNRRFTEVERVYCKAQSDTITLHAFAFGIAPLPPSHNVVLMGKGRYDMIGAADSVGYDPILWTEEIILRTEEEERIAQNEGDKREP